VFNKYNKILLEDSNEVQIRLFVAESKWSLQKQDQDQVQKCHQLISVSNRNRHANQSLFNQPYVLHSKAGLEMEMVSFYFKIQCILVP